MSILATMTRQPDVLPAVQPAREDIERRATAAWAHLTDGTPGLLRSVAHLSAREHRDLAAFLLLRLHDVLSEINNLLLPPLFTLIAVEIAADGLPKVMTGQVAVANYVFCSFFLLEWVVGLAFARSKRDYLINLWLVGDLISSLPLAYIFQAARLFRLGRVARFVKILKLVRARRFTFPIGRLARAIGVSASVALAGAFAFEAVEPETAGGLGSALWWSAVTITTVGYGDISPITGPGRVVGLVLMFTGVGVFSYLAGLMAAVVFDPQEDFIMESIVRVETKLDRALERLEAADEAAERP